MTVTLTGTGGLFTRLGKIIKTINAINTARGTTIPSDVTAILGQYASNPEMVPSLQANSTTAQNQYASFLGQLQTVAANTVIDMVNDDTPQSDQTLTTALVELIEQMVSGSASIQQNTVSQTTTAGGSNIGNGVLNVSLINEMGQAFQMPFAESIVTTCINDSQSGSAAAGNETFQALGQYAETNFLAPDFPLGSGGRLNLTAVNAALSNRTGTLTTNGGFESFTVSNTPDNWSILTGTAGTEVKESSSIKYAGSACVSFTGTGTNPSIVQVFENSTTGTAAGLSPLTPYSLSFWVRSDASLGAGTITVRLYDVTNSAVMVDASSTNNSLAINLSTLTTSFVNHVAVFRTPRELPATYRLEINLASIPSTHVVYVDHLSLTTMRQFYSGGPYLALHSGSIPFIFADNFTTVLSNNYDGVFAMGLEKTLLLNNKGLAIPFSGSPTIADSLCS